ncbi:nucleotidyl transferase AbiEii/AbiGii toxin family protein [Citreimonas salinaria]|uniref:Nucleotidyl transferase AbiEii toxin, Type IV TA system n=1 Tax=Citreimonas salinaria TaxID=321339 RepID=A0A1H3M0N2_9RHOB|nr:nucleotidyl transferase AbiEii/AbiGii toxin family protein [Citreimonas salinaria]SDY69844.1 Nucleotidyl transferase AbiEii toxin, Type IV TA system [Citreimonas salinaria]
MIATQRDDFNRIVELATAEANLTGTGMEEYLEKELLHYDILYALQREGLLEGIVFQGGTSLRLCHGSIRYSHDLDFAAGRGFATADVMAIKDCLETYLSERYGLDVTVKNPKKVRDEPDYEKIHIDAWWCNLVTRPDRPDLPRQKIKIEFANVTPLTSEGVKIRAKYSVLPAMYDRMVVHSEAPREILADKLVALPAVFGKRDGFVRSRDLWDISYLARIGAEPDCGMVAHKIDEYREQDYGAHLTGFLDALPQIMESKAFRQEMRKYLTPGDIEAYIENPGFRQTMLDDVTGALKTVQRELYPDPDDTPSGPGM